MRLKVLTLPAWRWYEQTGLMPDAARSHTGRRRFGNRDLDWLAFVRRPRMTGMPVADMVHFTKLVHRGEDSYHARPAHDHRAAEKVIKAVLIVAAVVGIPLLLYAAFFIGTFAMAG
ncbi:MerR family transcriptional regulator [Streptomyces lydicus]|uniref:MerR family transcriptional regulator n=1 Tax=Streptomyces lydicus TaxID=47763 RepID=UPI0037AB4BB6